MRRFSHASDRAFVAAETHAIVKYGIFVEQTIKDADKEMDGTEINFSSQISSLQAEAKRREELWNAERQELENRVEVLMQIKKIDDDHIFQNKAISTRHSWAGGNHASSSSRRAVLKKAASEKAVAAWGKIQMVLKESTAENMHSVKMENELLRQMLMDCRKENEELAQDIQILVGENEALLQDLENVSQSEANLKDKCTEIGKQLEESQLELERCMEQLRSRQSRSSIALAETMGRALQTIMLDGSKSMDDGSTKKLSFSDPQKEDLHLHISCLKNEFKRQTKELKSELERMQAQYERDQVEKEAMRDVAQEAFQKMKNVLQENKQLKRLISKFNSEKTKFEKSNSEKTKFEKSNSEKSALNSTLRRRAPAILSFLMARTPSETIKAGLDQEQPSENSPLHPSTEADLKEPLVENFNLVKYPNECIAKDGNLKQVEISLQPTDDKPADISLDIISISNEVIVDFVPIKDGGGSVENLPANDDDGSYNPFDAQEHIGCDEENSVSESSYSSEDEACEFDFQSSVSHRVMELSMNMSLRDSYTWEGSSLTSSLSSASARLSRMGNIGASLLSEHRHSFGGMELNEEDEDEQTEDEDKYEFDHQIEPDGDSDQKVSQDEAYESNQEDVG